MDISSTTRVTWYQDVSVVTKRVSGLQKAGWVLALSRLIAGDILVTAYPVSPGKRPLDDCGAV